MQKKWTYKNWEIKEGSKPGSSKFQYFFVVSEKGVKKSNYCVWIKDDALSRFDVFGLVEVQYELFDHCRHILGNLGKRKGYHGKIRRFS